MYNGFLLPNQIDDMVKRCESVINDEFKQTIKEIKEKFGIEIVIDRKQNINNLFHYIFNFLKENEKERFESFSRSSFIKEDYIFPFLEKNYAKYWNFVKDFDAEILVQSLQENFNYYNIYYSRSVIDWDILLKITDFKEFFNQFSIKTIEKEYIETLNFIIKSLETIFDTINSKFPNKQPHLLLKKYLNQTCPDNWSDNNYHNYHSDIQKLAKICFDDDLWNYDNEQKILSEKRKEMEVRNDRISNILNGLQKLNEQEVELTQLLTAKDISKEIYKQTKSMIQVKTNSLQNELDELNKLNKQKNNN